MNDPRQHHYSFAHERLPELVFKFRGSFLSVLRKNGDGYLKGVWYQLGSTLAKEERLVTDGLTLNFLKTNVIAVSLLPCPRPCTGPRLIWSHWLPSEFPDQFCQTIRQILNTVTCGILP